MRVNHYFFLDPEVLGRLDRMENALAILIMRSEEMSVEMDRLHASVARNTEVSASIVVLVEGLAQQIRDNAEDPDKLRALADEIDASSQREADAVVANTPTPPAPPPEPAPPA